MEVTHNVPMRLFFDVFAKRSCKNVQLYFATSLLVSCLETCRKSRKTERFFM